MSENSFGASSTLTSGGREYEIFRLDALQQRFDVARLPFSLKILLENLLRTEGNGSVSASDIEALAGWDAKAQPSKEIAFTPARVLMQDFTGVPAVVDLAAMRDAMAEMGGDPALINPLAPAELVIDHSVQVDAFGTRAAFGFNAEREFERNQERYAFLRWGQGAFQDFAVVPPDTGIVHQVNLEYLARVVFPRERGAALPQAYPDTLVGTDSHTTMVNGLGVLGWGVGGIEAEAAMLGQPMSMLIPQVLGFRLHGRLPEGTTATDLVLTVTEMLRRRGVVGMFVEFFGAGVGALPIADRATIGNMSPEFGSTCAIFPIDAETLRYLELSGRSREQIDLVEAYAREQGLWHDDQAEEPTYTDTVELDLSSVEPSLAGPKRPQDRVSLSGAKEAFRESLKAYVTTAGEQADAEDEGVAETFPASDPPANGAPGHAAPAAAPGSGLLGDGDAGAKRDGPTGDDGRGDVRGRPRPRRHRRHHQLYQHLQPLRHDRRGDPGAQRRRPRAALEAVGQDLPRAGLEGRHRVPRPGRADGPSRSSASTWWATAARHASATRGRCPMRSPRRSARGELAVVSVLSGNRNFEGRINPDVKMNYLASPPLCVAYALAGTMDVDIVSEPLGEDASGEPVYLRDIWPSEREVADTVGEAVRAEMFRKSYGEVFAGDERWNGLEVPDGERFAWAEDSTYVRLPPVLPGHAGRAGELTDIAGARVLALLGDSVTTDHISPAGSIKRDGPAGTYLQEQGVQPRDFNSYGSRRGNHEVMMRGTFANIRLKQPDRRRRAAARRRLHAAARRGRAGAADADLRCRHALHRAGNRPGHPGRQGVRLGLLARLGGQGHQALGRPCGHRRELRADPPLKPGRHGRPAAAVPRRQSASMLGLTGEEVFSISGLADAMSGGGAPPGKVGVSAVRPNGERVEFDARVRIDTPREADYFRHGGILQYVLRGLLAPMSPQPRKAPRRGKPAAPPKVLLDMLTTARAVRL